MPNLIVSDRSEISVNHGSQIALNDYQVQIVDGNQITIDSTGNFTIESRSLNNHIHNFINFPATWNGTSATAQCTVYTSNSEIITSSLI